MILLISFCATNKIQAQAAKKSEIDAYCDLLVNMTDTALKQKQFNKVVVYSNMFKLLKHDYKIDVKYLSYFKSVDLNYMSLIGNWIINCHDSLARKPLTGGYYNAE